jgi:hypothetical protein
MEPKRGKGRPRFNFTDEIIGKIEAYSTLGRPMDQIALLIGCGERCLEKTAKINDRIKDALLKGRAKKDLAIDKAVYDMITVDHSATMAIFYLKTQRGWKEPVQALELSGPNGGAVSHEFTGTTEKSLERIADAIAGISRPHGETQ